MKTHKLLQSLDTAKQLAGFHAYLAGKLGKQHQQIALLGFLIGQLQESKIEHCDRTCLVVKKALT